MGVAAHRRVLGRLRRRPTVTVLPCSSSSAARPDASPRGRRRRRRRRRAHRCRQRRRLGRPGDTGDSGSRPADARLLAGGCRRRTGAGRRRRQRQRGHRQPELALHPLQLLARAPGRRPDGRRAAWPSPRRAASASERDTSGRRARGGSSSMIRRASSPTDCRAPAAGAERSGPLEQRVEGGGERVDVRQRGRRRALEDLGRGVVDGAARRRRRSSARRRASRCRSHRAPARRTPR